MRDINFNKVARPLLMTCGTFFRTTPTEALWAIFDIMPFDIKARILAVKARIRTSTQLPLKWDGVGNPGRGHQRKLDLVIGNKTSEEVHEWGVKLWKNRWSSAKGLRQTKEFITDIGDEWFKHLIELNRQNLRIAVGFITGHYKFRKHLHRIGLADSPQCRFCEEEDEDAHHLIWRCPTFEQRRAHPIEKYQWFIRLSTHIGNLMDQEI